MTGKRIAIVLIDAFADWEVGLFAAAARSWFGGGIRHFTPGGRPVRSMGGLSVTPEAALESLDVEKVDALVLIGSDGWQAADAPDLGAPVRAALGRGIPVGAICGATLAVARSGVLSERRHTSNARDFLTQNVPGYEASHYVETPKAVADGGLVTAPGSAPVTFALALLGLLWPGHTGIDELAVMIGAEHKAG
jgi:putative intracellular protease/amidase